MLKGEPILIVTAGEMKKDFKQYSQPAGAAIVQLSLQWKNLKSIPVLRNGLMYVKDRGK
jgi:hypothetical protein